jgi:hypothetical protein
MIEEATNLERKVPRTGIDCVALGRGFRPVSQDKDELAGTQFLRAQVPGKANNAQAGESRTFQSLQIIDGKSLFQVDRFPFTPALE